MRFSDHVTRAYLREAAAGCNLVENKATYKQMMAPVIQAWSKLDPRMSKSMEDQATKYRNIYMRQDRIIWALRWFRLESVIHLYEGLTDMSPARQAAIPEYASLVQWAKTNMDKVIAEMAQKANILPNDVNNQVEYFGSAKFANAMHHFLSYVDSTKDNYIQQIDTVQFLWQTPSQIQQTLEEAEQEWVAGRDNEMSHAEDSYDQPKKLIDFGDGFAWWDLGVQFCDAEGKAMGHCGNNSYMQKEGDHLLSLRQETTRGGKRYQTPYLTFILDANDRLGEMKGRGNEKPAARYHPYIVALLKLPMIDGIKGGGYMPQNNFSVRDLDPETQAELIKVKPELETITDKFKRLGPVPEVVDRVYDEIARAGLPRIDGIEREAGTDRLMAVLAEWSDLESLSNHFYFDPLSEAISYMDDSRDDADAEKIEDAANTLDIPDADMIDFLDYLPVQYVDRIATDIGVRGDFTNARDRYKLLGYIDRSPKYADAIRMTFAKSALFKNLTDDPDWYEYLNVLVRCVSYSLRCSDPWFKYDDDLTKITETSFKLIVTLETLFSYIETADTTDEESDWGSDSETDTVMYAKNENAWDASNDYGADEYFRELTNENYTNDDEATKLIKKFHVAVKQGIAREISTLDPRAAADAFMRHVDWYEAEAENDDTDRLIMEIRRRSGIATT